MDPQTLQRIGLSKGEAQVYLALLRHGPLRSGRISRESGVSYSKVYKVLDRLMAKGMAGYVVEGKVKTFSAMRPSTILGYLDEEKKKIEKREEYLKQLMPQLEMQNERNDSSEVVVFQGFKSVINALNDMLSSLKRGEEYSVLGAFYGGSIATPEHLSLMEGYHKSRISKGVRIKLVAPESIRGKLAPSTYKLSEVRYLPDNLVGSMQITLSKNKCFVVVRKNTPVTLVVNDQEVIKNFRNYFNAFWKMAKP